MNVLEKLRNEILLARRAKKLEKLALLQTLMSESQAVAKKDQRDVTNEDVSCTAEKFVKNIDKTLENISADRRLNVEAERAMFAEYVIQDPFDGLDIDGVIQLLHERGDVVNVGAVMKAGRGRFNIGEVKSKI